MSSPAEPLPPLPPGSPPSARDGKRRAVAVPEEPVSAEESALRAAYPALAHLLGRPRFAALCRDVAARAETSGAAPGSLVHGLIVHGATRVDDRVPSRLAADIAALEWSIREVTARAPRHDRDRRAAPEDLAAAGASREVVLQPVRAFDIVPVAFRLDTWVRRLHEGRRVQRHPLRGEQHIVVHAPPFAAPAVPEAPAADDVVAAGADLEVHADPDELAARPAAPLSPVWWFALAPGPGALLSRLAMGVPVGQALDAAISRGHVADELAGRALLDAWLREGLFARVLLPEA